VFRDLVEHTGLVGVLNDPRAKFTLFVPLNAGVPPGVEALDNYTKRRIVLQHMLEKAVPRAFLTGSACMLVNTRVPGSALLITNGTTACGTPETRINDVCRVIGNRIVGTSQVFLLDRAIPTDTNPLSNVAV
jgi:hypothetical protein